MREVVIVYTMIPGLTNKISEFLKKAVSGNTEHYNHYSRTVDQTPVFMYHALYFTLGYLLKANRACRDAQDYISGRINVSVKIRLKKFGSKKRPYYRIVVQDVREPRDGKTIDEVGIYHPIEAEERQIAFDADKVRSWLNKGAQPTDTVRHLLNKKQFTL